MNAPTPLFDQTVAWLEAGAPERIFSMGFFHTTLSFYNQRGFPEIEAQAELKPHCGTVCCIAGYIAERAGFDFHDRDDPMDIEDAALTALGLPTKEYPDMLPIFSPGHAADAATPAQAAVAMRNWQANNFTYDLEFNPWQT